jgi:hypothetical protein
MGQITLKRGATLDLTIGIQTDTGTPVDLTGAGVVSQVRTAADEWVAALAPVITGVAGAVAITVLDTSAWPLGLLRCDVRVSLAGRIAFSDTFGILVTRSVTQ